jgi:hypothetical protein
MQRAKKSSRGARRGPRRQQQATNVLNQAVISHPPPIQEYAVRHGTRLRFVLTAGFSGSITYQNLLDTMLMAATTILGYDIFQFVKVRAVEAWASPLLGSAVTVAVAFDGQAAGFVGDMRYHTDTSMGVQPAHIKARPSPNSQASQFQVASAQNAFYLDAPQGSVVDVELTFVQSSTAQAVAAQNALVAATAGAPYWRGLDGLAVATTKFQVVEALASI